MRTFVRFLSGILTWMQIGLSPVGPATASAQLPAARRPIPMRQVVTIKSPAVITGSAVTAGNSPIPHARVRLRNVDNARIEGTTRANYVGEFSFTVTEAGNFLVELMDDDGKVVALGDPLSVEVGRTAGTIVRLPSRPGPGAGLFGNTAGAIIAAAAGMGITAVSTTGRAASPER